MRMGMEARGHLDLFRWLAQNFPFMSRPLKLKCPTCRKEGEWFSTVFGPFCSKRCKLVDLGKWFSEEQKISEPLRPEALEEFENLPPGRRSESVV